jgi:cytochrome c nitrite reductase small subunit
MSNKAKLFIAIVLVLIMIPVMSTVYIKDNLHNSSYCANCHEGYYATWDNLESGHTLAHAHNQTGTSCQSCHSRGLEESIVEVVNYYSGNYYDPLPEITLPMETCFSCHGSYDDIIPLLSPEITGHQHNPHDGHLGELECSECHSVHKVSINTCDECHAPVTEDKPGWGVWEGKEN